jgi:hypothetical protein
MSGGGGGGGYETHVGNFYVSYCSVPVRIYANA